MRRLATTFIFTLLAIPMITDSVSAEEPYKKVRSVEGITEYQFENGLQLLLFPDESRPTVTVNLTIFTGSRQEGYGESGMAHLLEHMLFKGTPTHKEIPKLLQERGAQFNGTTWYDRTNYYETLPASDENLEFALHLEADRMMNSSIRGEDLASEMTVVRNEFERGENSPDRILSQRIQSAAFDWHNYGKSTIGNRSDIERVPLPKLRAFYRRHYQPDNAMLMVAGSFDEDKALEMVTKYFGSIPKPDRERDLTYTEEPAQDGERRVTLRRVGDVGIAGVGYHIPAGAHEDFAAVQVLSYLLAMEPGGRLYTDLVKTKQASSVSGYSFGLHDPGLMLMSAEVRDPDTLEDVTDAMLESIESIGKDGATEEEVQRAKGKILQARDRELADSTRLAVSLSNWGAQGDWRLYFLYRDRVEQVTAEDVQRVAAAYLQPNNRTVGLFIPTEKPARISIPERPDVAKILKDYKGREQVAQGEKFDVDPRAIEKRTERSKLEGGLKVALLPKKTRGETVVMTLTLRYGDEKTLAGLQSAARLLPELMVRGAGGKNFLELKDSLEKQNTVLSGSGATGAASFSLQTKRENLPAAIAILKTILREADLPSEELETLRGERLAMLASVSSDPQYLANYRFRRTVQPYEAGDVRYTPTLEEQTQLYKDLKLEQLQKLYSEFLGGSVGELVIVGDFESDSIRPLLADLVSGWESKQPYEHIESRLFKDIKTGVQRINTPDKENAIYFGGNMLPMQDTDPDYPALLIGNFVLGGGALSSRLGDRVRQQEGLSYSVSSHLLPDSVDPVARWILFAISNPTNSPKLIDVIAEELELLVKDGITEKELEAAKKGYLQRRSVARTNDGTLAGRLSSTLHADRTMLHYAELEDNINALTVKDVNEALKKYLNPKEMVTIVAGDFAKAEAAKEE